MKALSLLLSFAIAAAPSLLSAQTPASNPALVDEDAVAEGAASPAAAPIRNATVPARPFSRVALGVGVSPLGI